MQNPVFDEAMRKALVLAATASQQGEVPIGALVLESSWAGRGRGF